MGNIDDFEFEIENYECIEIAGNYWWVTFQEISFEKFSMEYRIWNPDLDTLTLPRLCEFGNTYE